MSTGKRGTLKFIASRELLEAIHNDLERLYDQLRGLSPYNFEVCYEPLTDMLRLVLIGYTATYVRHLEAKFPCTLKGHHELASTLRTSLAQLTLQAEAGGLVPSLFVAAGTPPPPSAEQVNIIHLENLDD